MANDRLRKLPHLLRCIIVTVFLLGLTTVLYSQDAAQGAAQGAAQSAAQKAGYFIDKSGQEPRFIQRFTWTEDKYTSRYEVIFEGEVEGYYHGILRDFSDKSFIEVSLPPRKYRYRVIPYDFFGKPAEGSQWVDFEILAALKPELDGSEPLSVNLDADGLYVLEVSGKELASGAELYLQSDGGARLVPKNVDFSNRGKNARLVFDKEKLVSGNYELIIKNPGGLEASRGGISVAYSEPVKPAETASEPAKAVESAGGRRPIRTSEVINEQADQGKKTSRKKKTD